MILVELVILVILVELVIMVDLVFFVKFRQSILKCRVVHHTLIYENLKQEETDMPFLKEVLEALKEKYEEPTKSKAKQVSEWIGSKCKAEAEESEDPGSQEREEEARKETEDDLVKSIEKVEEVLVEFSEKFAGENQAATHQVVIAEMGDIKEKITDLREEIEGVKKTALPLWDKPN